MNTDGFIILIIVRIVTERVSSFLVSSYSESSRKSTWKMHSSGCTGIGNTLPKKSSVQIEPG